jgi:UDP-N-acetylmuramoyl-L-alanyl-D-glutamate--2,6-diaminopimelate ligase
MEEYRQAKARLFSLLAAGRKPGRTAVINADDLAGPTMVAGLDVARITFAMRSAADVRPHRFTSAGDGIDLEAVTPAGRVVLRSALVGEHNVMNLLGAIGVGVALGMAPGRIGDTLGAVPVVPGRFERVEAGQPFLVVVDYAHKPDALQHALGTARKLVTGDGRLAVVFGCGGDRDRGKRPLMGEIAARLADRVWVTSDNPRTERPDAIIAEILPGIERGGAAARHVAMADRRAAIRDAIGWARAGDVLVIAGKGHEPYQIIGTEVLPFDDREIARGFLRAAGPWREARR